MATAKSAFGAAIGYETTPSGGSYTPITGVTSITGPQFSMDIIDATDHDSPGGFEESISGLGHSGTVDVELNYDEANATHTTVRGFLTARAARNWEITCTDSGAEKAAFAGRVISFDQTNAHDGKTEGSFSIQISGQVSFS